MANTNNPVTKRLISMEMIKKMILRSPLSKNDIQADALTIGMNEKYKSAEVTPIREGTIAIAKKMIVSGPR